MRYKEVRNITEKQKRHIQDLFYNVFSESETIDEAELVYKLVKRLLVNPDQVRIFIAYYKDEIAGCSLLTRINEPNNDSKIYLLSPFAIATKYQGQGIGKHLLKLTINTLRLEKCILVVTYGYTGFYSKVGFSTISKEIIEPPFNLSYPDGWMGIFLDNNSSMKAYKAVSYNDAFYDKDLW